MQIHQKKKVKLNNTRMTPNNSKTSISKKPFNMSPTPSKLMNLRSK